MIKNIAISGFVVFFGLMLGRILGLVRDMYLASKFGTSIDSDLLILILTVPDAIYSLIASGAISASLIPEFKKLSKQDSLNLFILSSIIFFGFSVCIVFTLNFNDNLLIKIFSPGIPNDYLPFLKDSLSKVNWLIPLTILAGVSTAFLHYKEKFFMPSIGSAIINLFILIGLFLLAKDLTNLNTFISFILIGGLIRWFSQLWIIRKDLIYFSRLNLKQINKFIFNRYFQSVLSGGLLILYPVIARSFASFLEEGSISIVNYALKLVEVPANVAVTVLSIILLPKLSEAFLKKEINAYKSLIEINLFWSLSISFAITGVVLAQPNIFIESIFGLGETISSKNIDVMASLLSIGILSLPFQALISVSTSIFYSEKNTKTPMKINLIGFTTLIVLNLINLENTSVFKIVLYVFTAYAITGLIFLIKIEQKHKIINLRHIFLSLITGIFCYFVSQFLGYSNFNIYLNLVSTILVVFIGLLLVFVIKKNILKI
jgi:putative peptidoglycan lipid II flippase